MSDDKYAILEDIPAMVGTFAKAYNPTFAKRCQIYVDSAAAEFDHMEEAFHLGQQFASKEMQKVRTNQFDAIPHAEFVPLFSHLSETCSHLSTVVIAFVATEVVTMIEVYAGGFFGLRNYFTG